MTTQRSMLAGQSFGEAFHAALRRAADSDAASLLHNVIYDLPDDIWSCFTDRVVSTLPSCSDVSARALRDAVCDPDLRSTLSHLAVDSARTKASKRHRLVSSFLIALRMISNEDWLAIAGWLRDEEASSPQKTGSLATWDLNAIEMLFPKPRLKDIRFNVVINGVQVGSIRKTAKKDQAGRWETAYIAVNEGASHGKVSSHASLQGAWAALVVKAKEAARLSYEKGRKAQVPAAG